MSLNCFTKTIFELPTDFMYEASVVKAEVWYKHLEVEALTLTKVRSILLDVNEKLRSECDNICNCALKAHNQAYVNLDAPGWEVEMYYYFNLVVEDLRLIYFIYEGQRDLFDKCTEQLRQIRSTLLQFIKYANVEDYEVWQGLGIDELTMIREFHHWLGALLIDLRKV